MQGGCQCCKSEGHQFAIAVALQPIAEVEKGRAFALEALVRGSNGEAAAEVLAGVTNEDRSRFDQRCGEMFLLLTAMILVVATFILADLPRQSALTVVKDGSAVIQLQ